MSKIIVPKVNGVTKNVAYDIIFFAYGMKIGERTIFRGEGPSASCSGNLRINKKLQMSNKLQQVTSYKWQVASGK